MYLIPFVQLFPEQAMAETRTITTRGHPELPDDEYALVESYCTDPTCDCRRVMLNILPHRQAGRGCLAAISFGFDRHDEMAGPFLDPLNPQSQYAEVFLDIVTQMLETDPAYVARLESHYRQVKQVLADPKHPLQQVVARLEAEDAEWMARQSVRQSTRPKRKRRRRRRKRSERDVGQDRPAKVNRLIQQLIRSGNQPHPDLLADILACGEAAVRPLMAIISDPSMYWDDVRDQPCWVPEYAMGLLGDLRAEAAVPILIELLGWQNMDQRLEHVVDTLTRIGPAAAGPTKAAVLDQSLGWYPRAMAAQALVAQVYMGVEGSEALLEFLRGLLHQGPVECADDRIVYTLLAQDLADLQGMDAVETIQAAFERGVIDRDYIDWPDAEAMCQNAAPDMLQRYAVDFLSNYRSKYGR